MSSTYNTRGRWCLKCWSTARTGRSCAPAAHLRGTDRSRPDPRLAPLMATVPASPLATAPTVVVATPGPWLHSSPGLAFAVLGAGLAGALAGHGGRAGLRRLRAVRYPVAAAGLAASDPAAGLPRRHGAGPRHARCADCACRRPVPPAAGWNATAGSPHRPLATLGDRPRCRRCGGIRGLGGPSGAHRRLDPASAPENGPTPACSRSIRVGCARGSACWSSSAGSAPAPDAGARGSAGRSCRCSTGGAATALTGLDLWITPPDYTGLPPIYFGTDTTHPGASPATSRSRCRPVRLCWSRSMAGRRVPDLKIDKDGDAARRRRGRRL